VRPLLTSVPGLHRALRSPGAWAALGLLLLALYALPELIGRRADADAPIDASSLSLRGFESDATGALRAVAAQGDLHEVGVPIALRRHRRHEIRFDVLRPAQSPVRLHVDFYAEGYDRSRHERVLEIGTASVGARMRLRIDSGRSPERALLRFFYQGPPGLVLANVHFREVSWLRSAYDALTLGLAVAALLLAGWLAIVRQTLATGATAPDSERSPAPQPLAALLAIYLAMAVGHFAVFLLTPYWSGDEARYRGVAAALWQWGRPAPIGVDVFHMPVDLPSNLYPYLVSVAFAAGDGFYALIRLINALVMCTVVFPTFWIGRRHLSDRAALFVAALAAATPFVNLGAYVVTEVLFYPCYVAAAWLAIESLSRPRPLGWAIALGATAAVALCARPNGVVILPAFFLCCAWIAVRRGTLAELLRRPVWLAAPAAFLPAYLALQWLTRVEQIGSTGFYATHLAQWTELLQFLRRDPGGTLDLALGHLTTLSIPYALPLALLLFCGLFPSARGSASTPSRERDAVLHVVAAVFFAALFALALVFTVTVVPFDLGGLGRWHSRYYFHAYPLLALSFAALLARGRDPAGRTAWIWVTVAVLLAANAWFIEARAASESPWWGSIADNMDVQWYLWGSLRKLRWPILTATLLLTWLWTRDSRWLRPAACALALVVLAVLNAGAARVMQIGRPVVPDPCGQVAASFLRLQPGTFGVLGTNREFWTGASFWNPYVPEFTLPLDHVPAHVADDSGSGPDFIVSDSAEPPGPRYAARLEAGSCRIYGRR
jgi:4-amino-4-deoxy-L-arabinose transferase-like glycosyltransferase